MPLRQYWFRVARPPPHGLDPGEQPDSKTMVARKRGVQSLAPPAERQGTNRLSRAGVLQLTLSLAVRRPARPRPGHDHRTATGRGLTIALTRQAQCPRRWIIRPSGARTGRGTNRGCISSSWHEGAGCEAEDPRDVGGALGCALPSDGIAPCPAGLRCGRPDDGAARGAVVAPETPLPAGHCVPLIYHLGCAALGRVGADSGAGIQNGDGVNLVSVRVISAAARFSLIRFGWVDFGITMLPMPRCQPSTICSGLPCASGPALSRQLRSDQSPDPAGCMPRRRSRPRAGVGGQGGLLEGRAVRSGSRQARPASRRARSPGARQEVGHPDGPRAFCGRSSPGAPRRRRTVRRTGQASESGKGSTRQARVHACCSGRPRQRCPAPRCAVSLTKISARGHPQTAMAAPTPASLR